jgi:hypothetical protein
MFGEPPKPDRFWPTVAIIAIIAATFGWTTVGILVLGGSGGGGAAAIATETIDPDEEDFIDDASFEPEISISHDAPELEAMLPSAWDGTPLVSESFRGDAVLDESAWSTALLGFVEAQGKTAEDLAAARAYDEQGALDLFVSVFRLDGEEGSTLTEGLTAAWAADGEGFETTEIELGGKTVLKGLYAGDDLASYFYPQGDVVFDIETADEELAAEVLATLP